MESSQTKNLFFSNSRPVRLIGTVILWITVLLLMDMILLPHLKGFAGGWIARMEATHTAFLARLTGIDVHTEANKVVANGFAYFITFPCSGMDYLFYLATFTLLYPEPWRRRILAALVLSLAFYALILFRLWVLLLAGLWWPEAFEFFHESWNYGFIGLFILLWAGYIWYTIRYPHCKNSHPDENRDLLKWKTLAQS